MGVLPKTEVPDKYRQTYVPPEWKGADSRNIIRRALSTVDLERWRGPVHVTNATLHNSGRPELHVEVADIQQQYASPWFAGKCLPDGFIEASGTSSVPCINIYGRTESGESICTHVWNFHPYFYVKSVRNLCPKKGARIALAVQDYVEHAVDPMRKKSRQAWLDSGGDGDDDDDNTTLAPPSLPPPANKTRLRNAMDIDDEDVEDVEEQHQQEEPRRHRFTRDPGTAVVSVEHIKRIQADDCLQKKWSFFKVTMRTPNLIRHARDLFMGANDNRVPIPGTNSGISNITFESSVLFENRFMLDRKVVGGGWCRINTDRYVVRGNDADRESRCTVEVDVDYRDLDGMSMDNPDDAIYFDRPSTFRILSYDLECAGKYGVFPNAAEDPIIQIGATTWTLGEETPGSTVSKTIFVIGSCLPIPGVRVVTCANEQECLNAFGLFIQSYDPDIITGYNTRGFDNPYLFDRATTTNAHELLYCGRNTRRPLEKREVTQLSRNTGDRKDFHVRFEGRVEFDVMLFIMKNYDRFSSFTLNAMAKEFLGDQKEDLHHSMITPLQHGSAKDRQRIAIYCVKDTVLPMEIANKITPFHQMVEFARETGVQMRQIQGKGSTIKTMTKILAECIKDDIVMPYMPDQDKIDYEGATVLDPKADFYDEPVSVLDFYSLYPAEMIAHNLCFSTRVPPDKLDHFSKDQIETCPAGHHYIRREVREGILTKVLESLLKRREIAKQLLAAAKEQGDLVAAARYNNRQLALKVLCNSVYGFTALEKNAVYFYYVAESTTAFGRDQLEQTKRFVETTFTRANGYPFDANVIYGDTDSVMVHFDMPIQGDPLDRSNPNERPVPSDATKEVIAQVIAYSKMIAEQCTKLFVKPNALEFENVYWPYLLLPVKKRYAGPFWTSSKGPSYTKVQGLESKRRDNCKAARDAQTACIDAILYELDPQKALACARAAIHNLRAGKTDLSDLIITGRLNKRQNNMSASERKKWKCISQQRYKQECDERGIYTTHMPHAEVDRLLRERTGMGYEIGDRVPYILKDSALHGEQDKVFRKAEDPLYFLENNLQPDHDYYTTQIINCTFNVLAPIFEGKTSSLDTQRTIEDTLGVAKTNEKQVHPRKRKSNAMSPHREDVSQPVKKPRQQLSIQSFFKNHQGGAVLAPPQKKRVVRTVRTDKDKAAKQVLAYGDHTKNLLRTGQHMRTILKHRSVAAEKFGTSLQQCIGCQQAIPGEVAESGLCNFCRPNASEIVPAYLKSFERVDDLCTSFWEQCRMCQQETRDIQEEGDNVSADEAEAEAAREPMDAMDVQARVNNTNDLVECNAITCENFFRRSFTRRDRDAMLPTVNILRQAWDW